MTTIAQKVDYVKRQRGTGDHHCHWPGCDKKVPPAMWGCKAHWFRLPTSLRRAIWSTYQPGQEKTKTPSPEYVRVARAVQDWIAGQQRTASAGAAGEAPRAPGASAGDQS